MVEAVNFERTQEYQVQMILSKIKEEGGGDPILVMKIISSSISQTDRYQKAKSIEAELRKE
jgi:hypothetical protein